MGTTSSFSYNYRAVETAREGVLWELKIKTMNKADWHLFWLVIKKTAVTQEWVAAELGMGSRSNVSRAVRRIEDEKDPGILERKEKLENMYRCVH
jgi:hypothetical protein